MAITVQLTNGSTVSFPDDAKESEIQEAIARDYPPTGEDIAIELKRNPDFQPNKDQYKLYEDWQNAHQQDWIEGVMEGLGAAPGALKEVASKAGKGLMGLFTANSMIEKDAVQTVGESFAQGTAQLGGLLFSSTRPDSFAFRFKNLINANGTLDERHEQFNEARKYQKWLADLDSGKQVVLPESVNQADLETARNLSVITDPTLFLPAFKPLAAAGRLGGMAAKAANAIEAVESAAAKTMAKGAEGAAKAVSKTGAVAGMVIEKPLEKLAETISKSKAAVGDKPIAKAIIGSAVASAGVANPSIAAPVAGAYVGTKVAKYGGEVSAEIARQAASDVPSRLGVLERAAMAPGLSDTAKATLEALAKAQPVVDISAGLAKGALEGAGIQGGLAYWSTNDPTDVGTALGVGAALGAPAGLLGKAIETLSGKDRAKAIAHESNAFVAALNSEQAKIAKPFMDRLIKSGDHDFAAEVMDTQRLLGKSVDYQFVDSKTAKPTFEAMFPGEKYVASEGFAGTGADGRTKLIIDTDRAGKGSGFHETLHALFRSQVGGEFAKQMADQIGKTFSKGQIDAFVKDYVDRAPKEQRAKIAAEYANAQTPEGMARIIEEIAADRFTSFLTSKEYRDYLLKGQRDWTGLFIGTAKNTLGRLTDAFGVTDYRDQAGFNRIAKELIEAHRDVLKREANGETVLTPVKLDSMTVDQAAQWAQKHRQSDALKVDESGKPVGIKTEAEVKADRDKVYGGIYAAIESSSKKVGASKQHGGGYVINRRMLPSLQKIMPKEAYERMAAVFDASETGNALDVSYFPELIKKEMSQKSIYAARGMENRSVVPYGIEAVKNGFVVRVIDLGKINTRAQEYLMRPGNLAEWKGSLPAAMADLKTYIENLSGENPKPSAELLGSAKKRDILYKVWGAAKKDVQFVNEPSTGSNLLTERESGRSNLIGKVGVGRNTSPYISLRIDRIGEIRNTGQPFKFTKSGYKQHLVNFLPSDSAGTRQVYQADNGMRIVQGSKFRLYKPDGALAGVFDTLDEANSKADKLNAKPSAHASR